MRRLFMAAAAVPCLLGLFGGMLPGSVSEARADESVAACLSFEKNELDDAIDYVAENSCEQKLTCKLEWTLKCSRNDGKLQSSKKQSATFSIDGDAKHELRASAAACKQSWRIDDVRWSCK